MNKIPQCSLAIVASFLGDGKDGDVIRKETGKNYDKEVFDAGEIRFTKRNGLFHSFSDEPAVVSFGKRMWMKDNYLHREGDQPAVIHHDGTMEWWLNGKLRRSEDKPVIMWANGSTGYCRGRVEIVVYDKEGKVVLDDGEL
jgi:hypothetical protein